MRASLAILAASVLVTPTACSIDVMGSAAIAQGAQGAPAPPDASGGTASFGDGDAGGDGGCPALPASIVGWWSADGDMKDSARGHDGASGTQNGASAVTFAAGRVSEAFDLGGSRYVQIPNAADLQLTRAITIEAWIFPDALGGRIVDKITAGRTDGYLLDTYQSKLRLIIGGDSLLSTNNLPIGKWSHVAATWDGATARLFVDGAPGKTGALNGPLPQSNLALRIGADSTGANRFRGKIDEIILHDRALSPAEIAEAYAVARCR